MVVYCWLICTLERMDRIHITPFRDDSSDDQYVERLLEVLRANAVTTRELLGVFVVNARMNSEEGLFDSPISIDPYDQQRLLELRLASSQAVRVDRRLDAPIARPTELGRYVVRHALLTTIDSETANVPQLDTRHMIEALG